MESFTDLKTFDSSIISLVILAIIYFYAFRRSERVFATDFLFSAMVMTTFLMVIVDLLTWVFNGQPGNASKALNYIFNIMLFIGGPFVPSMWLFYTEYQIFRDLKSLKSMMRVFVMLIAANAAISISSYFTSWYFYIDAANLYHRGNLMFIFVVLNFTLMSLSFFVTVINRKRVDKKYFHAVMFFFIPPFIGMVLQLLFYGVTYFWVGMAVSLLVVGISIQNRGLNTDYLTGANNRRLLDGFIKMKKKAGADSTFSAIMLDFDGLKQINDTFGHSAGDEALVEAVKIIKKCLRKNDIVARTGGDEFVIIMDAAPEETLICVKDRIFECFREYNASSGKPYRINFSAGFGTCKTGADNVDEFFKAVDADMYEDKALKRSLFQAFEPE